MELEPGRYPYASILHGGERIADPAHPGQTMLLGTYGAGSRGIVWAHNSHLGDASATAMGDRGEHNLGQLARRGSGTTRTWSASARTRARSPPPATGASEASLPRQFDEWIWLDETSAVTPIGEARPQELEGLPETFPFRL